MSRRPTVAVDWDGTLVDPRTQEWLDDAYGSGMRGNMLLRLLLERCGAVIVHTCRATWPEGLAQVEAKLDETLTLQWRSLPLTIVGKPLADFYLDDRARDWPGLVAELTPERAAC